MILTFYVYSIKGVSLVNRIPRHNLPNIPYTERERPTNLRIHKHTSTQAHTHHSTTMEELRGNFASSDPEGLSPPFNEVNPGSAKEHFDKSEFLAAIAATRQELPTLNTGEPLKKAFELWYIRIQSLLILQQGQQAAEEISRNLGILEDSKPNLSSSDRISAWRLKILTVPVKTKGLNQSAVQQYYNLAYEARVAANVLSSGSEMQKEWLRCVEIAGQYALSTLIAMKDYDSAIQLLRVHHKADPRPLYATLLALLHITIGDTLGANPWLQKIENESEREKLRELAVFADDDSRSSSSDKLTVMWGLHDLYEGRVKDAVEELKTKASTERTNKGLVVTPIIANLALLYKLCYANPEKQYESLKERLIEAGNLHLESTDPEIIRMLG